MKVLLVGAGSVGARAARQLVDTEGVDELVIYDRRDARAQQVASAMGSIARTTDADPTRGLVEPLPDVVAVAVPGGDDVEVAAHAIARGVPCATSTDDPAALQTLRELDLSARRAGVAVVAGCGLAPGIADLLARHAADALEGVDEVHVARAGVAGPTSAATARRAVQDRAAEWRDGGRQELRRRGAAALAWFPDPIGARDCELVDMGVDLLAEGFPELSVATIRLAPEPRARRPVLRRRTDEGSWGAVRVEVWGWRGAAREVIVYGLVERTAVAAGTALALTAVGLARPELGWVRPEPGVHGLARVGAARPLLAELARRGTRAAAFDGVPVT